jgi:hypothetical protein
MNQFIGSNITMTITAKNHHSLRKLHGSQCRYMRRRQYQLGVRDGTIAVGSRPNRIPNIWMCRVYRGVEVV